MESLKFPLIEFLRKKIYFGSFDYVPKDNNEQVFLTIDDTLPYNNFHHDFGPLSVAHLYRFAVILHEVLGKPSNQNKELVFYSYTDPRSRANALSLLASYMILIQSWQPHQVLAPIAQIAPVMPFRDAGYSVADFTITIQDIVYALWRAKQTNLIELKTFDLEEYEHYEMVEHGDLNAIGDKFVAFASPVAMQESNNFVLEYFKKHNVRLVVRLNSPLYDKSIFEEADIKHVDLIFEDGSCPSMTFVKGFIGLTECIAREGGKIAVHCRAGLGRTGCLIGAHLIYSFGFTASEAIAYMRFLRPGMVVGPQQHWLYQHQNEFREWRLTMEVGSKPDPSLAGYSPLIDIDPSSLTSSNFVPPRTPERNILTPRRPSSVNSCLPQPTPGQPRKTPSPSRVHDVISAQTVRSDYASNSDDDRGSISDGISDDVSADNAAIVVSTSRKSQQCNSHVSKQRSVSAKLFSHRPGGRQNRTDSSDPSNLFVVPQRRNITDLSNLPQKKSLVKQLRVASNPSPRRRNRLEEVKDVTASIVDQTDVESPVKNMEKYSHVQV